jgi:hypothetical protein
MSGPQGIPLLLPSPEYLLHPVRQVAKSRGDGTHDAAFADGGIRDGDALK